MYQSLPNPNHLNALHKPPLAKKAIPLNRLAIVSSAVNALDKVASASQVPGLAPAVSALKLIVDTLKNAKSNVEDALSLAERLCSLMQAISKQCMNTISQGMKDYLDEFHSTLEGIQYSLAQITSRESSIVKIFFGVDATILKDCHKSVDIAMELFKLQSHLSLHTETAEIRNRIQDMGRRLSLKLKAPIPTPMSDDQIGKEFPQHAKRLKTKAAASNGPPNSQVDIKKRIHELGKDIDKLKSREDDIIEPLKLLSTQCRKKILHVKSKQNLDQPGARPVNADPTPAMPDQETTVRHLRSPPKVL
ncbi:hypothetical protein K439DRAFT_143203 [Ramaria rubella]|nr:hypothetical protein K439DRAFT_143203 [Ramaria rubella]